MELESLCTWSRFGAKLRMVLQPGAGAEWRGQGAAHAVCYCGWHCSAAAERGSRWRCNAFLPRPNTVCCYKET